MQERSSIHKVHEITHFKLNYTHFTNSVMTSSIEKLASEMINYSVSIAKSSSLCHGNNAVRLSPCSHQAMIQLVTPGPRLAKCCVKNREVWEGALIVWIFFQN